jgi:quinol-cytochrome oxidoreductase complex cytochrome b subunit
MRGFLRALLWIVLAAAVVALLFLVVFPWFDRTFLNDPTLGA